MSYGVAQQAKILCKMLSLSVLLTHWNQVRHICTSKLTIIGSDNGSLPGHHRAIIWINAGILLIGPLGTNFNEVSSDIHTFSFKKLHLKMSSGKWWPFCLGQCVNGSSLLTLTLLTLTMPCWQFGNTNVTSETIWHTDLSELNWEQVALDLIHQLKF